MTTVKSLWQRYGEYERKKSILLGIAIYLSIISLGKNFLFGYLSIIIFALFLRLKFC